MVGTAVYQVGLHSSIQPKNFSALKPGVQNTRPPAESGASTPAMSPWMWNSGMMLRPQSEADRASVSAMLPAETLTLRCDSGTILGRDVVPDVCRISAISCGCAGPFAQSPVPSASSRNVPAPCSGVGTRVTRRIPSLAATAMAGEVLPVSTTSALALRSER